MKSVLKKLEYLFVWEKDDSYTATINFIREDEDTYKFLGCSYKGLGAVYGAKDWEFMFVLSKEVLGLIRNVEKGDIHE